MSVRKNPSKWTTIAAIPFRRSPEILHELRDASDEDDLEQASRRLEEWTGTRISPEATHAMEWLGPRPESVSRLTAKKKHRIATSIRGFGDYRASLSMLRYMGASGKFSRLLIWASAHIATFAMNRVVDSREDMPIAFSLMDRVRLVAVDRSSGIEYPDYIDQEEMARIQYYADYLDNVSDETFDPPLRYALNSCVSAARTVTRSWDQLWMAARRAYDFAGLITGVNSSVLERELGRSVMTFPYLDLDLALSR